MKESKTMTTHHNPNETENEAEEARLAANLDRREHLILAQQERHLHSQYNRRERHRLRRRDSACVRRLWAKREAQARRPR